MPVCNRKVGETLMEYAQSYMTIVVFILVGLALPAAALTLWSMCLYLAAAWPELKGGSADKNT